MELFSTPENYKNYESKSLEEIFKDSEVLKYLESYISPISIGFDIETGGHVFQLFFTNSSPLIESGFIPETTGSWANGDIYFGFNISRVFTIVKPKSFQE